MFKTSDIVFKRLCIIITIFIFTIALLRAENSGITMDEAYTYQHYSSPSRINWYFGKLFGKKTSQPEEFKKPAASLSHDTGARNKAAVQEKPKQPRSKLQTLLGRLWLNNHILNSLLILFLALVTGIEYNELLIRLPSLFFYLIYIYFAFQYAKKAKYRILAFLIFTANYYLNEYFSLARGYGMAAACVLGASWFFNQWKFNKTNRNLHLFFIFSSLGALANQISMYVTFGFMLILIIKYRKNIFSISFIIYYFIFAFVAVYTVFVSRKGKPLYSSHNFFEVFESLTRMFSSNNIIGYILSALFIALVLYLFVRSKFYHNDNCLIFIAFLGVSLISDLIFGKGFPAEREMVPVYPIVALILCDAVSCIPSGKLGKAGIVLITLVFCFQFMIKINLTSTADWVWYKNYGIRDDMYEYALSHDVVKDKEAFFDYSYNHHDTVASFYWEKINLFMRKVQKDIYQ
jgi:hypothetical protein